MYGRVAEADAQTKPVPRARSRPEADDIKSLRHGLAALRLAATGEGLSSGELARACGLSRAAAFRLLQTLEQEGYFTRSGAGNRVRYRRSQRVRQLSEGYDGGVLVLEIAMPLMLDWTREQGWPLALSTPDGDHAIVRFTTDPAAARALIRYRAGERMCALMSASALLSLAFQPPHIQAQACRTLPRTPLPAYAPPRTAAEIATLLERVRRDGYAVFRPLGLREATLAVPIMLDGILGACLAMRYMLVADRGDAGHADRLKMLRALAERIAAEARRRLAPSV